MGQQPLSGVRILDFTWAWAGPYATCLLGMMGAEVIKVESRQRTDHSRRVSLTTGQRFTSPDQSTVFNDLNMGKRSITLNLTHPKAVELALELGKVCDVVAENMRPGVMERMGLGYEAFKRLRPDIIMLSSSAMGATGPQRLFVGYAPTFSALGGLTYITGYEGGPPVSLTGSVDLRSATTSALAIMAALAYRQRTGRGQFIDMCSRESITGLLGEVLLDYAMNRRSPTRVGNHNQGSAPYYCYPCHGEDQWITLAVTTDEEWEKLCKAMGNPSWTQEERFATPQGRWEHHLELDEHIARWTSQHTAKELTQKLQEADLSAFPSQEPSRLFQDPHIIEREVVTEVNHPVIGRRKVLGRPWRFSASPNTPLEPAPMLGQHNDHVFGELLGLSAQEISSLKEEKVIY